MKILIINSGSSSIKYRLFDTKLTAPLCKGIVERIGSKRSSLTHTKSKAKPTTLNVYAKNHEDAIKHIFDALTSKRGGVIASYKDLDGIGHRIVHGTEVFTKPRIITDKVIKTLERFNHLAPLHNPPAILAVRACKRLAKGIRQVGVFDTAFYNTIPDYAYIYGIPYEFYSKDRIRRYGFHGTSHKFVAKEAAKVLKKPLSKLKLITCHLGNGCSITAVKNAKAIDTSMGFTPLEGLLMGTRCGDIDPAVVLYIMDKRKLNIRQMDNLLNKKSGILGLSGISNDMRDVLNARGKHNKRAELTVEIFLHRVKKYIGAYTASMDGLDAVVLTAGIGENAPLIRKRIQNDLKGFLKKLNAKLLVIPTNEELMIAQESAEILK